MILQSSPDERDKCLSPIIFLQKKNKQIICKALKDSRLSIF